MRAELRLFGKTKDGRDVYAYALQNKAGMRAECITYGATLRTLMVPGKSGKLTDVVLGYDDIAGYENDVCFFGATIGRFGNRIRGGRFWLNGKNYALPLNDGPNHLHGGKCGFNKRIWQAEVLEDGVAFSRYSPDGEEGYPGGLSVTVSYRLSEDNALVIAYCAAADDATLVNLTNHSYFNLAGHDSGNILAHHLTIDAPFYTPGDSGCVPTGEIAAVANTPMDFTAGKPIGQDIRCDFAQLRQFGGYDHNFVLKNGDAPFRKIALVQDPVSGRKMQVSTDLPGVQLYTGNGTAATGKGGAKYEPYCAFCLETQYFPDCANHRHFEGPVLQKGASLLTTTEYRFI
ncbi:MAG: galactose mutarotase [Clostridiales bacterium]|jgi:aldose 1-epimerase|nr:galactose mutarotase [Clostridiales bacterium]